MGRGGAVFIHIYRYLAVMVSVGAEEGEGGGLSITFILHILYIPICDLPREIFRVL
jgi:hypothetical protein